MEASSGKVDLSLFKSWPQGLGRDSNRDSKFMIEINRKQLLNNSSEILKGYNLWKYHRQKLFYQIIC